VTSPAPLPLDSRPHVVYRMYGPERELLYVGITLNVEGRIQAHRDGKEW
jgi:predicted GIY-YIG superfamily endonuclease